MGVQIIQNANLLLNNLIKLTLNNECFFTLLKHVFREEKDAEYKIFTDFIK